MSGEFFCFKQQKSCEKSYKNETDNRSTTGKQNITASENIVFYSWHDAEQGEKTHDSKCGRKEKLFSTFWREWLFMHGNSPVSGWNETKNQ